jgi:hypothetical protein
MNAPRPQTALPVIAGVLILVSEGMKFLAALFLGFILVWSLSGSATGVLIVIYFILLAVSIAGGIAALQRRSYGLALAGAIISALPFSLFGIAAIVLIALSRKEFPS